MARSRKPELDQGSICAQAGFRLVCMAWILKPKKHERFYLLPGMGGRNLQRKQRVILSWSIAAGLVTSAILAGILYLISRHKF